MISMKRQIGFYALMLTIFFFQTAQADECCTHLGKKVTCPQGLPPGSGSVKFVPNGTEWKTPKGETVFVPQATFAPCPASSAPPNGEKPVTKPNPRTMERPQNPRTMERQQTLQPGTYGQSPIIVEPSQPISPVMTGPSDNVDDHIKGLGELIRTQPATEEKSGSQPSGTTQIKTNPATSSEKPDHEWEYICADGRRGRTNDPKIAEALAGTGQCEVFMTK